VISKWTVIAPAVLVVSGLIWAADFITLQGERTVYTANCDNGTWEGNRCTGSLSAGGRFRFRALKAHSEVFFWNVGVASDPTGKFTGCEVTDGRNWTCQPNADGARSITLQMRHGKPVPDTTGKTRASHPVSKLTWTLLRYGAYRGNTATPP